jgi:hypothetical protein
MLKARVIKSAGCFRCKSYLKELKARQFDHLIYDADLQENQEQLDKWKVNMMPVIQIVDDEAEFKVVHQFPPGRWSIKSINAKINALAKKKEK